MPCFHPLTAYRSQHLNASGKRSITFNPSQGYKDLPVTLPCGQCIGCRLERSRQWAIRMVHEASLYKKNCFITLTYANEHLPPDGSLRMKDFQDFMKRLRKRFGPNIRFFHCGEYGEKLRRPHYHACLFNFDFPDKKPWRESRAYGGTASHMTFISPALMELWPYGHSAIGSLTFESAAYVSRYVTKKITGKPAEAHYEKIDFTTGEITDLKPEYTTMSRRPGIGKPWLDKFLTDVYPSDQVVIRGKVLKPPRFYDAQFDLLNPEKMAFLKGQRKKLAKKHSENNTPDRLAVREFIQLDKCKLLTRRYENET